MITSQLLHPDFRLRNHQRRQPLRTGFVLHVTKSAGNREPAEDAAEAWGDVLLWEWSFWREAIIVKIRNLKYHPHSQTRPLTQSFGIHRGDRVCGRGKAWGGYCFGKGGMFLLVNLSFELLKLDLIILNHNPIKNPSKPHWIAFPSLHKTALLSPQFAHQTVPPTTATETWLDIIFWYDKISTSVRS